MERPELSWLVMQAENVGNNVRELNIDLCVDIAQTTTQTLEGKDTLLSKLINRLPNIRSLTVRALSVPIFNLPRFIQSMATLKSVRHLQIIEIISSISREATEPIRCPVTNGVVYEVVKSSGDQLLSLVFDGHSSLQPETFNAIRSIPTKLETLLLGECIGIDCREALCEEVPWACRSTLRHLGFYDCRGAHSGGITCGVASGLWSTCLRTLEVCKSGDHSDIRGLPYHIEPRTQPLTLERAHFEHAFEWEIVLLGRLRVRELTLTLLPRRRMLQIVLDIDSFPGMKRLTLGSKPDGAELDDGTIQAACDERRLDVSFNGKPILGCTCSYGKN